MIRMDSAHARIGLTTRTMAPMATLRSILLIDDDANVRESLRMVLEDHQFLVSEANDGEIGIAKAIAEQPKLIIVDMMMPRTSGFVVIERLKQHYDFRSPIIMLSGNTSEQQRAYAEFLGVDRFLSKPVKMMQLLETIQMLYPVTYERPTFVEAARDNAIDAYQLHG